MRIIICLPPPPPLENFLDPRMEVTGLLKSIFLKRVTKNPWLIVFFSGGGGFGYLYFQYRSCLSWEPVDNAKMVSNATNYRPVSLTCIRARSHIKGYFTNLTFTGSEDLHIIGLTWGSLSAFKNGIRWPCLSSSPGLSPPVTLCY